MRGDKLDDPIVQILHGEWTKLKARFCQHKCHMRASTLLKDKPQWYQRTCIYMPARTTEKIAKTKARPCFWHTDNCALSYIFPPEPNVHKNSGSLGQRLLIFFTITESRTVAPFQMQKWLSIGTIMPPLNLPAPTYRPCLSCYNDHASNNIITIPLLKTHPTISD